MILENRTNTFPPALLVTLLLLALPFKRLLDFDLYLIHLNILELLALFIFLSLIWQTAQNGILKNCIGSLGWWGIAFILFATIFSMKNAVNQLFAVRFLLSVILLLTLLYYFVSNTKNARDLFATVSVFLISIAVLAVFAVLESGISILSGGQFTSSAGLLDARNEMTFFILPAYLIAFSFAASSGGSQKKYVFLSMLFLLAIVLSRGRAATWIAIATSIIAVFYFMKHRVLFAVAMIIFVVGAVLLLSLFDYFDIFHFLNDRYMSSFFNEYELNYGSLAARQLAISGAFSMIESNPVFGVGAGNFGLVILEHIPHLRENTINPHNTFLGLFAEIGPLGLLGFCMILVSGTLPLPKRKKQKTEVETVRDATTIALLGLIAHMLTFDAVTSPVLWILLAINISGTRILLRGNS